MKANLQLEGYSSVVESIRKRRAETQYLRFFLLQTSSLFTAFGNNLPILQRPLGQSHKYTLLHW